jgi:hypothetical protein
MAHPLSRQLGQAHRLARLDPRRPQQGNLHRAVSTAYYGLFHFLLEQAIQFLVGVKGGRTPLGKVLARAFMHGEMVAAAKTFAGGSLPPSLNQRLGVLSIPTPLRALAERFVTAQERRHLADYDLLETFWRRDVISLIRSIDQAINGWKAIRTDPAAHFFLIALLVWNRIRDK